MRQKRKDPMLIWQGLPNCTPLITAGTHFIQLIDKQMQQTHIFRYVLIQSAFEIHVLSSRYLFPLSMSGRNICEAHLPDFNLILFRHLASSFRD